MNVSLNLVKQYGGGFDPLADGLDAVVRRVGAQLGAIEDVIHTGPRYDGIVVVRVVSCEEHPNADKLHVCRIDDGGITPDVKRDGDGYVQVVCGAPNVREGLTVAWLPPGSTVPSTYADKEPFVLSTRELRGVVSNGMLASASELGMSEDHTGILEITAQDVGDELTKPGTPFKKLYGLDDVVLDLENKMFTHRPDCFGTLGVARELAGIAGVAFVSPEWYTMPLRHEPGTTTLPLEVSNHAETLVPRFMAQVVSGVTVGPSPLWLQAYLARVGIKSINNVVDLTNYYMMLTGQPLHAFDYDKLLQRSKKPTLGPRMAREGEVITLLGGKEIKLTEQDIVIATDSQAVAIAGVMGGADTEVDETTKTIVIECATFDMYSIRRTSMRHGLFTDAVTRFTKGQSPLQNDRVLGKIVDDLVKDGAIVASEGFDMRTATVVSMPAVTVTAAFINERLGSDLSAEAIKALLDNVELQTEIQSPKSELRITPPFWRTDLELPEDIVEEVGRLHGFDRLPVELPARASRPAQRDPLRTLKQRIRAVLKAGGANEVLGYSFVHEKLLLAAQQDPTKAYKISNAISPDLQYYRLSLTPSLLEKTQSNIRGGYDRFAIYEIGKTHSKRMPLDEGLPPEGQSLALVYAASPKVAQTGASYYQARVVLDALAGALGVRLHYRPLTDEDGSDRTRPFERTRAASVYIDGHDRPLGVIGEYGAKTRKALKLPDACAGFEIDLDVLMLAVGGDKKTYQPLPKFPKVTQDISLRVGDTVLFGDLYVVLEQAVGHAKPLDTHATLEPLDIYRTDEGVTHMAFRLHIASYERTMHAEEVNALLDSAASDAHKQLGTVRI